MRNLFIAAAIITTSFAALADGEAYANPQVASSSMTSTQESRGIARAPITAFVSGEGAAVSGMPAAAANTAPALSRAAVREQLDMARRNGELSSGEFRFAAGTRIDTGTQIAQH